MILSTTVKSYRGIYINVCTIVATQTFCIPKTAGHLVMFVVIM